MSIIFEALKKIEEEKREDPLGGQPPVFAPPAGRSADGGRPSAAARAARAAAVAVPVAVLAVVLLRQNGPGRTAHPLPAPVVRAPEGGAAPRAAIEEVRIKPRSIVPAIEGFPRETDQPPPAPAPAAAPAPAVAQIPTLRLRGLTRSGTRSWAFINDRMLKVGDSIEGAEVVEILTDRVKLKSGGAVFTLTY